MDIDLQKRINDVVEELNSISETRIDFLQMDPVAKMMLVALMSEAQKINDKVDAMEERLVERYCEHFIPRKLVDAMPSLLLLAPQFKPNKDTETVNIGSNVQFSYKIKDQRQPLNYIPVFSTTLIPYAHQYVVSPHYIKMDGEVRQIDMQGDYLYLGLSTQAELESLNGVSLLIRGTRGLSPEQIQVDLDGRQLDFVTVHNMEDIQMLDPFDAQQSSSKFFSFLNNWKEGLLNMEDATLVYITDSLVDRDVFKPQVFPRVFTQWLESEDLDVFTPKTVWLRLKFPGNKDLLDHCEITVNVVPVANVDVNTVRLTQSTPIVKLQKSEDSYFLDILETSNASQQLGFNKTSDEIIIRDFDAACYHSGDLYRDVRNLYNHFIDDYYAFVEYNGIKDGETLKQLRETINKMGMSVREPNEKFCFDSGCYVMRNMGASDLSASIQVNYMTTQGKIGNLPAAGEFLENRKLPLLEKNVAVVVGGMCGTNKANQDEQYELLRYFSLTNDRLYTRMDIEAFLRKEIIAEFGKEEFNRISILMDIAGVGGETQLQRGLYIQLKFKDDKNFVHAASINFDKLMQQRIVNKACIAMPIHVTLVNLEDLK